MTSRWRRPLAGKARGATVSCPAGQWHVALRLEMEDRPAGPNRLAPVGVDRGVEIALVTSDGGQFHREMWTPEETGRLVALQRRKAWQLKGSNRYQRTCRSIARLHPRAADRRRDFAHKTSTHLAKIHGLVAVEALTVPALVASQERCKWLRARAPIWA